MKILTFKTVVFAIFSFLFLYGCTTQISHDHEINPAYRPVSEYSGTFLNTVKEAKVSVYPSLIRTLEGTSYSKASQQQIVSLLNANKVTHAVTAATNLDPGQLKAAAQWDIFVNDMHSISDTLRSQKADANYSLVMEVVFPPGNQSVWGIHCYIFDLHGNNAFSFLLNSHHKLFSDAQLRARDASESAGARLVEKATSVGMSAFFQQLNAPDQGESLKQQGYSVASQKVASFDKAVEKIFIVIRLEERLVPVFMHSFKHSLVSAFEANGVDAMVKFIARDSNDFTQFDDELNKFSPNAVMHIDLDPLTRAREDGFQAVVGTDFDVRVSNHANQVMAWQANGKVDYIQTFFSNRSSYIAHEGIRKEFAWHTVAAIVRSFISDVNAHESAPIYTVTEDRQLHQQRTD